MLADFVHLKVRSGYSVINSVVKLDELAAQAEAAVALTDLNSLAAAFKFFNSCHQHAVKPILGCTMHLDDAVSSECTLLCTSPVGLQNLSWLVSQVFLQSQARERCLPRAALTLERCQGLIALSGGVRGEVGALLAQGKHEQATASAQFWSELFPERFYLEVQRFGRAGEHNFSIQTANFATELGLPVVATNDVLFVAPEDYYAHEVRVAIANSERVEERVSEYSELQYLRSSAEMRELFADMPAALANSVEIAQRCNLAKVSSDEVFIPEFQAGLEVNNEQYLRSLVQAGLQSRLDAYRRQDKQPPVPESEYYERVDYELDIIVSRGFVDYFLIVHDFVHYAHQNNIPVGPGRGSGAGSLVAYALNITNIDPLEYKLFFERFLNPERKGMPDFDIDFCYTRREKIIDYMLQKYGEDRVAQINAYGTFGARGVIHDVVRVLGKPRGLSTSIVDEISGHPANNLYKTLNYTTSDDGKDQTFYAPDLVERIAKEDDLPEIIELALKLEGLVRNISTHAAGVVIAPSSFANHCPIYQGEGDTRIYTQWDKDDLEASGLVKFDFLGLRTLSIIDIASQAIDPNFDIYSIDLDDKKVYADLCAGNTVEVFQMESSGMRRALKEVKPANIEEIMALISLFRPGPMEYISTYANVKFKKKEPQYAHESVESILDYTYGVLIYQEQVMLAAQKLAGYSMGEADNLRREISKKKVMEKSRPRFVEGAVANGLTAEDANKVFDDMAKFAGYGFNKAHAAAYALLGYQTSWLKVHYPKEFMTSALNTALSNNKKIVDLLLECERLGFKILPPDINKSRHIFTCPRDKQIRFGLAAVKGLGVKLAMNIVKQRRKEAFSSIFDLAVRLDSKLLNKRSLIVLIKSGACSGFGVNTATLLENVETILQYGKSTQQRQQAGALGLFASMDGDAGDANSEPPLEAIKELPSMALVRAEYEVLGRNLRHKPLSAYASELNVYPCVGLNRVNSKHRVPDGNYLPAVINAISRSVTKRGSHALHLDLHCDESQLNAVYYYEHKQSAIDNLKAGDLIFCEEGFFPRNKHQEQDGEETFSERMNLKSFWSAELMRSKFCKAVVISIASDSCDEAWCERLGLIQRAWMAPKNSLGVELAIKLTDSKKQLVAQSVLLTPSDQLLQDLRDLPEVEEVGFVVR